MLDDGEAVAKGFQQYFCSLGINKRGLFFIKPQNKFRGFFYKVLIINKVLSIAETDKHPPKTTVEKVRQVPLEIQ